MAGSGIQGIGLRALMTFQRALQVTSHNIANVTTPGYHRQEALLTTAVGQNIGVGYVGGGVDLAGIRRNYDGVLAGQFDFTTTTFAQQSTLAELTAGVDSLVGPNGLGLDQALNDFFASLNTLTTDPASPAVRGGVMASARGLAERFRIVDAQLDELRNNLNARIQDTTTQINTLAQSIAQLNQQISSVAAGPPPNDLLDQRAALLTELSSLVDVSTYEDVEGNVNIAVASGQSLVLGTQAASLTTVSSDYDPRELEIAVQSPSGGPPVNIGGLVTGGALGGALEFRRSVLDPTQNDVGRIAAVLVDQFNRQHQAGVDLEGLAGGDFFSQLAPTVLPAADNTGADATVVFEDTSGLTGSDYRLEYDGSAWTLSEVGTGRQIAMTASGGDLLAEGLRITPPGTPVAGDSFEIRPTRLAARGVFLEISDANRIAAADPAAGAGAVGDATNAVALAELQELGAVGSNGLTLSSAYQRLVTTVGTESAQYAASTEIYAGVLSDIRARIDAASGVNLDEEALNLQRYQQAYQAAAEVVAVADSVFETLLSATRR